MRVQTFISKTSVDAVQRQDEQINHWIEQHNVEPRFVSLACGTEEYHESGHKEYVVVTQIWY